MLRAVARTGSITAAADSLDVTASAGSQQLQALEREIGVTLLERSPRSVRLTEAGQILAERAGHVLAEIEAAECAVQAVAGLQSGRLRIGSFPTAAAAILPSAMVASRRRRPGVRISLTELEPEYALPSVRRADLDVAIAHEYGGSAQPEKSGLRVKRLFTEPLLLAVTEGEGMDAEPIRLSDLTDADWISTVPAEGFQAVTEQACRAAGFEPRVPFRADDYAVARALVSDGLGIALIPGLAAIPTPGVGYRPIEPGGSLSRQVFAVARQADPSPIVADFLDDLVSAVASSPISVPLPYH